MMKTTWSKPTKYLTGVGLIFLGIYLLYLSRPVVPALIMAALIAVIVRPLTLWLQQRLQLSRGRAVGLVYLCLAILVPLAVVLILPMLIDTLTYVGNLDYQGILQRGAGWLHSTLMAIKAAQLPVAGVDAYVDRAIDTLLEASQPNSPTVTVPPSLTTILQPISSALGALMQAGANLAGALFSRAAMIVFMFLASIYISLDAPTYRDTLLRTVPPAYQPEISYLLARIERVWNGFFHGELTLMLVIGVMTTIGLIVLGVPGALYLGIIAGLLEIVPTMGPIIATVPAVIVALVQGSATLPVGHLALAGLIILFYLLVQQVENNLIVPRVLGDAVELPPLIVMTGVIVGASVGGILGALLATPVIATGREVLRYIHRKLLDQDPIQIEESAPQPGISPSSFRTPLFSLRAKLQRRIQSRSLDPQQISGNASPSESESGHGNLA
jgi:predicted PurR-regulated permease PerM